MVNENKSAYLELIEKGQNYNKEKNYKEEIKIYRLILSLYADDISSVELAGLYIKLANAYYNKEDYEKAAYYYEEYLKLYPDGQSSVFGRLAHVYYYTDIDKCIDYHNKALNIEVNAYDSANKLFAMIKSCYYTQAEIKEEAEFEADIIRNTLYKDIKKYTHDNKKKKNTGRLNIGYLSSDCYTHTMMNYIMPIWENHNREEFNITIFNGAEKHDSTTDKIEKLGYKVISCAKMNNKELAKAIYDENIDILIDLGGFTHLKSYCAFYKPAPIIISYLGYINTLGIKEFDYILTDRYTIPEECADLYTEKPLYTDNGYTLLSGKNFSEKENSAPIKENGYVTYGSYNCTSKMSDAVLHMWSKILEKNKTAKLLIYRTQLNPSKINYLKQRMKKWGMDLQRVIFDTKFDPPFYNVYSKADIALDTYPFGGMTICAEAAMMGVPTITLTGEGMQTKGAGRINEEMGISELNAQTGDEYINKAVELGNNPQKITQLRKTLRKLAEENLMQKDAVGFTRNLEEKYKQIWSEFINSP